MQNKKEKKEEKKVNKSMKKAIYKIKIKYYNHKTFDTNHTDSVDVNYTDTVTVSKKIPSRLSTST